MTTETDCWVIFKDNELLFITYSEEFANLNDVVEEDREKCTIFKNIEGYQEGKGVRLIDDGSGHKIPEVFELIFSPPEIA
tara:strand:+ start:921 stop:1160 length:240 start_codon:yes stop_codon:yes gene_type:complete